MKRRVAVAVAVVSIVAASAVAVELAARVILKRRTPERVVPQVVGRRDSLLGWSLVPGASGISRGTGVPVEYRINSLGLRGRETSYQKPAGVFRIVVVGDSRTFGFGVPVEKLFTTLLEGYFRNLEVINLGVSGYGVDQELLRLRQEGFRYEPDLVLAYVAHYGDNRHMHTVRWGAAKPRFVLKQDSLVLTNSPVIRSTATRSDSLIGDRLARKGGVFRILSGLFHRRKTTPDAPEVPDSVEMKDPGFRAELYRLGEAIVFAMQNEAQRHHAAFVLVTHIDTLQQAATARKLNSLNVYEALHNKTLELPPPLGHLNEAGNGILAWEIARYLEATELVPRAHRFTSR